MVALGQGTGTWQNFSIGNPPMKVLVPGEPTPQNVTLPKTVQDFVKTYQASYYEDGHGLVITIMHVVYSVDVVADLSGALEGTNGQWKATGSKVAILSTSHNRITGKSSIQERGKLINGGEENDYMDIVIGDGPKLWQVIVMVPSKDAERLKTLQKIVDSITFK